MQDWSAEGMRPGCASVCEVVVLLDTSGQQSSDSNGATRVCRARTGFWVEYISREALAVRRNSNNAILRQKTLAGASVRCSRDDGKWVEEEECGAVKIERCSLLYLGSTLM